MMVVLRCFSKMRISKRMIPWVSLLYWNSRLLWTTNTLWNRHFLSIPFSPFKTLFKNFFMVLILGWYSFLLIHLDWYHFFQKVFSTCLFLIWNSSIFHVKMLSLKMCTHQNLQRQWVRLFLPLLQSQCMLSGVWKEVWTRLELSQRKKGFSQ